MPAYASNLLSSPATGWSRCSGCTLPASFDPASTPRYVMMLAVPLFLAVAAGVRILLARRPGPALVAGATGVVFGARGWPACGLPPLIRVPSATTCARSRHHRA